MLFKSTKGSCPHVSFEQAVLQGFAPDGGLYVPVQVPQLSAEQLQRFATLSFVDLAVELLALFVEDEVPREHLSDLVKKSYAAFTHGQVVCHVGTCDVRERRS
jgi:threonine synthase